MEKAGGWLSTHLIGAESMSMKGMNFIKPVVKPPVKLIESTMNGLPDMLTGGVMILLGVLTIFVVITFIGKLLKSLMVGKAKDILHSAVGRGPISGITSGTVVTVLVQSSSTTTSLVVPLAGSGVFSLRQVYPFTLGANIGTCITALLAATAIVGPSAVFALQIALVHLLYNVLGVLVIYSIPFLRELPIKGAEKIADVAVRNKLVALGYIAGMFFVIPFVMIGISNLIAA